LATNDLGQGDPPKRGAMLRHGSGKDEAPRRFSGMLTLNALRKPPPAASNGPKRAKRRPQRSALSQRLLRDFPKAFKYPPVPLAIGIGLKLRELLGAEFKPGEIRGFLQAWTSGPLLSESHCSWRDATRSRRLASWLAGAGASRRCTKTA
jgi:hypothetical protein